MASCFFLLRQFEDVLIYLNSIKVNVPNKVQVMWFLATVVFVAFIRESKGCSLDLMQRDDIHAPSLCRVTSITMMPLTSTTLRLKQLSAATKKQKR